MEVCFIKENLRNGTFLTCISKKKKFTECFGTQKRATALRLNKGSSFTVVIIFSHVYESLTFLSIIIIGSLNLQLIRI